MSSSWQTSVVLITSSDHDESHFGTGFAIDKDEQTTCLLTCTHVVRDVGGPDKIEVYGTQARVIASNPEEGADLAVLCVEKSLDIPPLPLYATSEKGKSFSTAGFQLDGKRFVIRELHGKLGEQVGVQMRGQAARLRAWDLEITDMYLLQPGYSGSPVVDEYGNVIGVVNTRRGEGKTGVAISIEALRKVWPEMPRDLFKQDTVVTIEADPSTTAKRSRVIQAFETVQKRFNPAAAAGINKTIQWDIHGEEAGRYAFRIVSQKCELVVGGVENPDTTLSVNDDDWLAIAEGRLALVEALARGKVQVRDGNMKLAIYISQFFPI